MRHLARYEVFEDHAGEWRWRLRSANGEILAQSEGYTRKEDAARAIRTVRDTAEDADDPDLAA